MSPGPKTTIGRIVRFLDEDGSEWPAIITVAHSDMVVSLQVFRFGDIVQRTSVPYLAVDNLPAHNLTWHWPERA